MTDNQRRDKTTAKSTAGSYSPHLHSDPELQLDAGLAREEGGALELYQSEDGSVHLDVRTDGETVWLTRQQLASLFGRDVKTIGKHVANAQAEELVDIPTVAKFATVQKGRRSSR